MKMNIKRIAKFSAATVAAVVIALIVQSFVAPAPGAHPKDDKYRTFVKTKKKCSKCSGCNGYWGYKHGNGTYEGNCQNTDGHGHTCGHGPEKHGLKKW